LRLDLVELALSVRADANLEVKEQKDGGIAIHRPTLAKPLLIFNAPEDGRPFVHPLLAPDGNGELTEFSPGHHKHQTGLYVGFLKVNGATTSTIAADYFRRVDFKHQMNSEGVVWTSVYELLDAKKSAQLVETQSWHFRDFTSSYLIDFTWSAKAKVDVVFDKYEYGGLFLRMPWKNQPVRKRSTAKAKATAKPKAKKRAGSMSACRSMAARTRDTSSS